MTGWLHVELRDAFSTVIASGDLNVNPLSMAFPEEVYLSEDKKTLRMATILPAILASSYVQDRPLNPNLPLHMVVSPCPE